MRTITTLPCLAFAVLVGACGGGSDESVPTSAAPLDDPAAGSDRPAADDASGDMPAADAGLAGASGPGDDGASDCDAMLPCLWTSDDGSATIRLTAAQGEQSDDSGDFRLDFSVEVARALELGLARTSALAVGDTRLGAALVTLEGRGSGFGAGTSAPLVPGTPVAGSVEFLGDLPDDVRSLDVVTLALSAAGRELEARFRNVPAGPPDTAVDCALALPCAWTSPDGTVTVTVDDVGVRSVDGRERLAVAGDVSATRRVAIASEGYTRASAPSGETFGQAVLDLGGTLSRFGGRVGATLEPGDAVRVTVGFESPERLPDVALDTLRLSLFELAEPRVPYWNPLFLNLPLGD